MPSRPPPRKSGGTCGRPTRRCCLPVRGRKHPGRDAGRMVVAGLLGDLARHQPARPLEIEHKDLRFEQRGVHPLPLARIFALDQRHNDPLRQQQPGAEVVDRDADPHRPLARHSSDRHQPAHPLGDLVNARPLGVGPGLAKPGNAAVDDARVDLFDALVIDAEPVFDGRAEILDDDICGLSQLKEDREPVLGLQVERQAALVAMEILEIEPVAARPGHIAAVVAAPLDLDDIGAPIGELAHRGRPGAGMGQVENGVFRQRQGSDAHECGPFLVRDIRRPYRHGFDVVWSVNSATAGFGGNSRPSGASRSSYVPGLTSHSRLRSSVSRFIWWCTSDAWRPSLTSSSFPRQREPRACPPVRARGRLWLEQGAAGTGRLPWTPACAGATDRRRSESFAKLAPLETCSRSWVSAMALSIKTDEADRLARRLAKLTGETMTEAVTVALRERLARERARREAAADLPARVAAFSRIGNT